MIENKIADRISFLAKKFNVFDGEKELLKNVNQLEKAGNGVVLIEPENEVLAYYSYKENGETLKINGFGVSIKIFSDIIAADPTNNKSCVQWLLNTFTRLIRVNIQDAYRFVNEDLPQAKEYITIFELNKRKNKFKDLCKKSKLTSHIVDPSDINQYKSLSQLYDVVDPFIEKDKSELEKLLNKFVEFGEAEIPYRDRKFTVFIPKTRDANVIFDNFANWCTAKKNNGMFSHYTKSYKTPDNKDSNIYIIINNDFFKDETDININYIYQLHFESNQIKDKRNSGNIDFYEEVVSKSEGLGLYLKDVLMPLAKLKKSLDNIYLKFLIKIGFCDALFELFSDDVPAIHFIDTEIPRIPDLSRFKKLDYLTIVNCKAVHINEGIGNLKTLEMLILAENKLTELPSEIGNLKKLLFLNINGNPIKTIPDSIRNLDKSNGGSLHRIAAKKSDIGEENYNKLKKLLPSALF